MRSCDLGCDGFVIEASLRTFRESQPEFGNIASIKTVWPYLARPSNEPRAKCTSSQLPWHTHEAFLPSLFLQSPG